MGWSWKIARVAGIDVRVHATFWVLLVWIGLLRFLEHGRAVEAAVGVAFVLAIFAIVVLHELGHALAARGFGVRTRDITLLPIGGLARLERMPEEPGKELAIAAAGPAVNLVLAALCALALFAFGDPAWPGGSRPLTNGVVTSLLWINVSLAGFNLIPAFPMDGGRMLRALLALRLGFLPASRLAARIGQGLALGLGLLGLLGNPMLVFVALFVWIGAEHEVRSAEVRGVLEGLPVRAAMVTELRTLEPDDALAHAVDLVLSGAQQDFPVLEQGRYVGLLTRARLLAGLASDGARARVAGFVERDVPPADPDEPLQRVLERLAERRWSSVPVLEDGALLGLLTLENVGELVAVRSALARAPGAAAPVAARPAARTEPRTS